MIDVKPKWKAVYESERANQYDKFIFSAAMNYEGALNGVLEMASRTPAPVRRILDLGAGTGILTARALERFPDASIVAVDGSESMLAAAKRRLAPFGPRAAFLNCSFEALLEKKWDAPFDLIVSSFAFHHMDYGAMKELLARLYAATSRGGQLVIADYVLSRSAVLQDWYEDVWVDHRLAGLDPSARAGAKTQMRSEHEATKAAEGDNPARLDDLVQWTRDAGYRDVDCHWKYYCYAVYGGLKR